MTITVTVRRRAIRAHILGIRLAHCQATIEEVALQAIAWHQNSIITYEILSAVVLIGNQLSIDRAIVTIAAWSRRSGRGGSGGSGGSGAAGGGVGTRAGHTAGTIEVAAICAFLLSGLIVVAHVVDGTVVHVGYHDTINLTNTEVLPAMCIILVWGTTIQLVVEVRSAGTSLLGCFVVQADQVLATVSTLCQKLAIGLTYTLILPALRSWVWQAVAGRRIEVVAGATDLRIGQLLVANKELAAVARLGQICARNLIGAYIGCLQKSKVSKLPGLAGCTYLGQRRCQG